jgi:stage III sporulation protein AE
MEGEMKKKYIIKKYILKLILSLLLMAVFTLGASAADKSSIINEQSQKSGASGLYQQTPDSTKKSLNEMGIKSNDTTSLSNFTPAGLFKFVMSKLKSEAEVPLKAATAVFGVLLACALLNTMKNSFGEKPLKDVFNIVCTLCISAVLLVPITQCISAVANTVKNSADFMLTFLPVFVALVGASGHPASAITFQGLLLVSSQVIAQIASNTFVPMVNMYLAFCVIGSVSPGVNIGGIAAFVRKIVNFGLLLCITIFTGILTVQGLISQAADTVTIKTAKFVVGSVVPVIGSTISDAVNTVVSCANLLKTTTGAFAIIVFIVTFLPPILDCILWMLVADISIAVAEMLGINNITGLLKAVKEAIRLLIALVLTAALAMIISVSVMLLLGLNS